MISLEKVSAKQKEIFDNCMKVVAVKGADYNRKQQKKGDTLFNMRVTALAGLVRSPQAGILIRLQDKLQRLASLENPAETPATKDEAVKDTIQDAIVYLTYFQLFYEEERDEIQALGKTLNAEADEEKERTQGASDLGY